MNILYHHRTLGDGAEGIHIEEMIAAFRQLGHHVTVVSPVGERTNRGNQALSFGQKLKAILPRVVFEMLEVGYNLAGMLAIWKAARVRRPDFIYDRYITFNAAPILMGRWLGVPVILEVNAPLALERSQQPDEKLILQSLAHRMERWICSHAHRTLVVSTPLKDYLVSIGVPAARIEVLPNGANLSRFTGAPTTGNGVRERFGIHANEVVVGFTGIMRPWHGIDMLLEAFRRLRADCAVPSHLLLVGDGPIRAEIEAGIRSAGLEGHVTITGRVSHLDIPAYVHAFDIAVSPKATFYASPMKILEYMAQGKPVVAPGMPNISDIIEDGVDGLLFRTNEAASLAEGLATLAKDAELRQRIGALARRKVEERLNWIQNARTVLAWTEDQPCAA